MKVAFLTREYPPDTAWGGIATMYHSLACALTQYGHEVHVVCQAVDNPCGLVEEGVFIHRVGTNPKRYSALARANYSFNAWLKLRAIIKRYGIDVVEATHWGAEAFLYSFRKNTPLVVRVDVSASDVLRTKTYSGIREFLGLKALSLLEGYSVKRADRVIAISRELYTRISDEMHINPERVDIVYHAVDTTEYRYVDSDVRQRFEISPDIPLVLFVGRFEARKGVNILCQAIPEVIKKIPEAMFLLIGQDTNTAPGSGSMRSHLLNEAANKGFNDKLLFSDFMPPDDLIPFYSACDVFVLPSFQEGSSVAIMEAMACGKPVVVTETGLVPELNLDGTNGIAVQPGDVTGLAEAVVKLLLLSGEEKRMVADRNRELIEREFAISRWIEEVVEVYEKALNTRVNR